MPKIVVIDPLSNTLPFKDVLDWQQFQSFCTDLIHRKYNCDQTREYLKQGAKQDGIDIYTVDRNNSAIKVAQCKLVKSLTPTGILKILNEFLKGDFVATTGEFILCTNCSLNNYKYKKTLETVSQQLSKKDISFKLWDEEGLATELRNTEIPEAINIVYRYFNEEVAEAFYGDKWKEHIRTIRDYKKRQYEVPQNHIERSITSYEGRHVFFKSTYWKLFGSEQDSLVNLFEHHKHSEGLRIVLLSIAGFGKSQELKYVSGYFSDKKKPYYPIKFNLQNYEGKEIELVLDIIDSNWRSIATEHLLLIFDGLDEIQESDQRKFTNKLNAFTENNTGVNILVSSRYNAYDLKHEPLNNFEVYILNPLSNQDTERYIETKLGSQKDNFKSALKDRKFESYIDNPYYLTRLIHFYDGNINTFPKNKFELFDKILFEQLEKDEGRHSISVIKKDLLVIAQKVSFCMTTSEKSFISDEELNQITETQERDKLKQLRIINRNTKEIGEWAFEHKNMQEYLCATFLSGKKFNKVLEVISHEFDRTKLVPNFLNTVSFLFEIPDKNDTFFQELFTWLKEGNSEVLIRFEKEQLTKSTRQDIFFNIYNYYKQKDIPLRVTSNFSIKDLATFIDIDSNIVNFCCTELIKNGENKLTYDLLSLLQYCPKPFLYRQTIEGCLLKIISSDSYSNFITATCIEVLAAIDFNSNDNFKTIIQSNIDLQDFNIRIACIEFLKKSTFSEDYVQFIFESIVIYEKGQKEIRRWDCNENLKKLIVGFKGFNSIKKTLQYCVTDDDCISRSKSNREFHFNNEELKVIFLNAKKAYKADPSIARIPYRLYCQTRFIIHDENLLPIFKDFFQNTIGTKIIFLKFFKYDKRTREYMEFADEECCDYLIDEYINNRIDEKDIIESRNTLSWINKDMFSKYQKKLEKINAKVFGLQTIDWQSIRSKQLEKNQLMLLNKALFIDEALTIFKTIKEEQISIHDLWDHNNETIAKLQDSIVLHSIRNSRIDKFVTQKAYLEKINKANFWDKFVVQKVVEIINNSKDNQKPPVKLEHLIKKDLLLYCRNWVIQHIEKIDFETAVVENVTGSFSINRFAFFIKDAFTTLKVTVDDNLLLKMIDSDYEFFVYSDEKQGSFIMNVLAQIGDMAMLKETVLRKLKENKLPFHVIGSYYKICKTLKYIECLPLLYESIISYSMGDQYYKTALTKIYLSLGGHIADFKQYVEPPQLTSDAHSYSSWNYFLIDEMVNSRIEKEMIAKLLENVLDDENSSNESKSFACERLIKLSEIRGLKYWINSIKHSKELMFEHRQEFINNSISEISSTITIPLLINFLEFIYKEKLNEKFQFPNSIEGCVQELLVVVSLESHENYLSIKQHFSTLILKHSNEPFCYYLKYYSERLTQRFFEKRTATINFHKAFTFHQYLCDN
jgi:hypothetical protein